LGFMNWFLHFFLDLTFCICKTGLGHQAKYRMSIWAQRNDMGPCYQHWGLRQGLGRGQRVKAQVWGRPSNKSVDYTLSIRPIQENKLDRQHCFTSLSSDLTLPES
jgi:hypothetical protein